MSGRIRLDSKGQMLPGNPVSHHRVWRKFPEKGAAGCGVGTPPLLLPTVCATPPHCARSSQLLTPRVAVEVVNGRGSQLHAGRWPTRLFSPVSMAAARRPAHSRCSVRGNSFRPSLEPVWLDAQECRWLLIRQVCYKPLPVGVD